MKNRPSNGVDRFGGIVMNANTGDIAMVQSTHGRKRHKWVFPKGAKDGEDRDEIAAASREIEEEIGVKQENLYPMSAQAILQYTRQQNSEGIRKIIQLFPFATWQDDLQPSKKEVYHPAAKWVSPVEVASIVGHKTDQKAYREMFPVILWMKRLLLDGEDRALSKKHTKGLSQQMEQIRLVARNLLEDIEVSDTKILVPKI